MRNLSFYIVCIVLLQDLDAEEIYEIDAVVGNEVELPCNVTSEAEGDKLNILAWYRGNSSTAFYSRDLRSQDSESGDISSEEPKERFTLVAYDEDGTNNLQIHSVKPTDAGRYRCMADFAASPSQNTYIQLNVIEPPQRLWVIHENGTRVATASAGSNASENIGPYYVGDWVHLFCVAFGGKPLANLTWWSEHEPLKDTWTPLSEQRVRSDLEHGPLRREDHGLVLSCTANNNDRTPPLAIDIVVHMYLPPELVSIRDMNATADGSVSAGRVRAGQILHLQCRVLGARPSPVIQWRLNSEPLEVDQNIIREPAQRLVISEVQLVMHQSHDESQVTCCAPSNQRDEEALLCAQAMPLSVIYQPVLEVVVNNMTKENNTVTVVKGRDLVINCSYKANPSVYQIMWFHEDDIISEDDNEQETLMRPILQLTNVTEQNAGEYVCAASNDEGSTYSEPLNIDVTYTAYCEDPTIAEYGLGEGETMNITCKVKGNPEPAIYRWILINGKYDPKTFRTTQPHTMHETTDATLQFQRPNGTAFNTIVCVGLNGVEARNQVTQECSFLITDETVPRPPADCQAVKGPQGDISIECLAGHDGGIPQKFKFSVNTLESDDELVSIVSHEPKFIIQEPKEEKYKFVIIATNDKGDSIPVEIEKEHIIDNHKDDNRSKSAVTNITTLALSLCGGVALVALAACGLVLCAHERGSRLDLPRTTSEPPLCAYNTEESNCETYHDSDEGSECNVRRTESFRRAISRYPSSKNYDVRRTSSFHSARYMNDMAEQEAAKCGEILRHNASCRVHSLQNISRKREMEAACDHLVMHLPPDPCYQVAKPMNTFYTMPRKNKNKSSRNIRDDTSEITQTSDGFSLPPPPDEFGTYRAASRIKDIPVKSAPTCSTIKKSPKALSKNFNNDNVIISPMNTVGLPTISGTQTVYSYPDDDHNQDMLMGTGFFTFQSFSSPKESGI